MSTAIAGIIKNGVVVPNAPIPEGAQVEIHLNLESRFRELARQWKEATALTSSTTEMVLQPAYQQIIGMGKDVLPLLFAELRRKPDHWFWALKSITGEDPVPAVDRGNLKRMTEAWLVWADQHGY